MLKKHFSDGSRSSKILKSDFKYVYDEIEDFKGYITLLKIKEVSKVGYVPRENREDDCIVNKGYTWLSIYPIDKNYAITAMFNDKDEIVEWYFDITNGAGIENDIPFIEDLYLDVVVTYLNEIIVLDKDELEQAYNEKDITKEQFELALRVGEEIVKKYSDKLNIKKLHEFTIKCLNSVKKNIRRMKTWD